MPLHFIFRRLDQESFPQVPWSGKFFTRKDFTIFKEVSHKQIFFIDEGLFPQ